MPNLTLTGVVLGHNTKAYDFTKDDGERVKGESTSLWLWDERAKEPVEVKVATDRRGLLDLLGEGSVCTLGVAVRANNNRSKFTLEAVLES